MTATPRSAFYGAYCTHVRQREDAVHHMGRDYVPTVYGQPEGNTVWISSLAEYFAAGGTINFNEDSTEIHLSLPAGHKFSCQFELTSA